MVSSNICIFAKREVDRSPTGSGVSARMAVLHARGLLRAGEMRRFQSVTGAIFTGAIASASTVAVDAATWRGHHTGAKVDASASAAAALPSSAAASLQLPTVVVEVGGRAHYTGESTFIVEEDDALADGFLLKA